MSQVKRLFIPKFYISSHYFTFGDDIAVLQLVDPIVEEKHIKFAAIPYNGVEPTKPGDKCVLVGWGSTSQHGWGGAYILQKASLEVGKTYS